MFVLVVALLESAQQGVLTTKNEPYLIPRTLKDKSQLHLIG